MNQFCKIFYCCSMAAITTPANAQYLNSNTANNTPQFPAKDSIGFVHIHQVRVTGNSKTKEFIILRELKLKQGDSIKNSDLDNELNISRQQVYNTTLFNSVNISAIPASAGEIDIEVKVKERWYIYPIPQFQIVDRNLNEWIKTHHTDLNRVNSGVKFVDFNLTGRRDQFRVSLLNGYNRNISLLYIRPFCNASLTKGFSVGGGYAQNREVIFKTNYNNKTLSYNNGNFIIKTYFARAGYNLRRAFKDRHLFNISYTYLTITDSILGVSYNPKYLNTKTNSVDILDLSYTFQHVDLNNISYPLKGISGYIGVSKRGLGLTGGINMFSVEGGYNKYFDLKNNWYLGLQLMAKIKLPFEQPYINQRAIGYGESYLRGLEYYVVDGVVYSVFKATFKKKIIEFSIPVPFRIRANRHPVLPFTIFAKTYTDAGYAFNKKAYDTWLNDKFLYTGGAGIDILALYDVNLRIEYSCNQLGQKGLFLHVQGGF